ncbi:hypothetical protein GPECTOR_3g519 [Gonium pectorale]|uniref:C3H1-type domain-containing protein n=1 Tax=Gonium pectorale TaxID=33097 RepID=A0A150H069_GONPE|nr:hypothetical protein GPECTOR_3g519 [Gonium pectorale]|eukprot:KXZ55393.1 hypothetical protein GPECTOR_3g519 [Gonium pectorale]
MFPNPFFAAMGGPFGPGQGQGQDGGRGNKGAGARKTRLCEKFMSQGHCPYGDKCTFAHGHEELRSATPRDGPSQGMDGPMHMQLQQQQPPSLPGPAPPSEPFPGSAPAAAAAAAGPRQGALPGPPPAHPPGAASSPSPPPPAAPKAQEVTFVDKVRSLCGVLGIGNAAALAAGKPLALQTAAMSLRNGNALRENPFADSVERYLQQNQAQQHHQVQQQQQHMLH